MISKHYVIEHHGQFISRFCYDVTLLIGDLSSARLFPTVAAARETIQVTTRTLGVHPAAFKVRSVHADLDLPHPTITMSSRCIGGFRKAHATPTQSNSIGTSNEKRFIEDRRGI
jgi:hypothetical protein